MKLAHFAPIRSALASAERLVDALVDPQRRERTVVALLVGYVVIWTGYAVITTGADVHFDMAEAVVLSRDPAFGYAKHPPLSIWIAGLWFTLLPLSKWAFYLLAFTMPAIALWAAWRLSARWLDAEKRVVGIALLTLIPFFSFHALKFNANTVLIPFWALTTLWFVRSYDTSNPGYAALAGLGAAAAMLGKYWSIFLIAGLALAALCGPRRRAYFRSPAPWITVAVGAAVLAPHVHWLFVHDFLPFSYAVSLHGARTAADAAAGIVRYLIDAAAYVAVPVALALIAARAGEETVRDLLLPRDGDRRFAVIAFWAPLLLPVVVAIPAGARINALWTMPSFALLPVVLLSSPQIVVPQRAIVAILAVAIALPPAALALSPIVALANGWLRPAPVDYRVLAQAIERLWQETTPRPLRIVAGDGDLVYGAAFHLPDRPSAFAYFSPQWAPWLDQARIAREGMAGVCAADDQSCLAGAEARVKAAPAGRRITVDVPGRGIGAAVPTGRYVIVTVPPQP